MDLQITQPLLTLVEGVSPTIITITHLPTAFLLNTNSSSFPLFVSLGTNRMLSELILSDREQFIQNHCPYLHVFSALIIAGLRSVEENDVWWQRDSRNQQNHDLSGIKPKISWCQLTFHCCWCSLLFATSRGWPIVQLEFHLCARCGWALLGWSWRSDTMPPPG